MRAPGAPVEGTIISVVIPTCNHPDLLRQALSALRDAQDAGESWEAIVVDNSEDSFRQSNGDVTASFGDRRFRYSAMPRLGLMAARHRGAELARGRVISFIDDDSFVHPTWFKGLASSFRSPAVMLVTGPNYPAYEVTPPAWLESLWSESEFGKYNGYFSLLDFGTSVKEIPPTFVWGCNYSIRKDIFLKAGGSHPDYLPPQWKEYQGDGEVALSVKVGALGYAARYEPRCGIRHLVPARRMTKEYLAERAYFNGLHCSFTAVRRQHGLGPMQGVEALAPARASRYREFRAWATGTWLGTVKRLVFKPNREKTFQAADVVEMREHLRSCYAAGWNFHQEAVSKDRGLLEYVLRPHYMGENARIPSEDGNG